MTKIITYEGNSFNVSRTYDDSLTLSTTLSAFTVTLTIKENLDSSTALSTTTGVVSGQGVVFTVSPIDEPAGVYHFEITAESSANKVTLEQDRMLVKESLVYET